MKFGSQSNLGAMSFLERGVLLGLDWGLEQVLEWASRSCILGPCVHVRVWVCVGKDKAKSLFTNHTSETKNKTHTVRYLAWLEVIYCSLLATSPPAKSFDWTVARF